MGPSRIGAARALHLSEATIQNDERGLRTDGRPRPDPLRHRAGLRGAVSRAGALGWQAHLIRSGQGAARTIPPGRHAAAMPRPPKMGFVARTA